MVKKNWEPQYDCYIQTCIIISLRCFTLYTKELQCMYISNCRPVWIHYSNLYNGFTGRQKTLDPDHLIFSEAS